MGDGGVVPVDRTLARSKVQAPAISLMVAAGIGMGLQLLLIVTQLLGVGLNWNEIARRHGGAEGDTLAALVGGSVLLAIGSIGLIVGGLVVYGAFKMSRLESHGLAMTAAILSMVPCLAPCSCSCLPLSLPLGVWALIVLNDPAVRQSFA